MAQQRATPRPRRREGDRVPEATFEVLRGNELTRVTSEEVFAGRTVVVFALPGAFTPTCSSSHVPRYEELADALRRRGVDEVVCVSVNDAYVMAAWRREVGARRVRFLADGNGEFTEAMGLLVDRSDIGLGPRSWRYSMLVRDGVIEKLFVEREEPGDPYDVSDADTMLRHLDPEGLAPPRDIVLFTKPGCGHCARARRLLDERGLEWEEVRATPRNLRAVSGNTTTPQVFIDGVAIGGADELTRWLEEEGAARAAA